MVSLTEVKSSNSRISSTLPPELVAVFVGATSGIGEVTLKTCAKYATRPRVYFVGRSQEAADRIVAECKALNPGGEYIFLRADVSLIRVVDRVCEQIKAKENNLNLLFLSTGVVSLDRSQTSEGVHLLAALTYYSRVRFIAHLLPLLRRAPSLRRVVTVLRGSLEGPLDPGDLPGLRVPLLELRSHIASLMTLGLESVAKMAPEVSFVHDYPGSVDTPLFRQMSSIFGVSNNAPMVPIEESGERHLYLATSARFPPKKGSSAAVPLQVGADIAVGTTGEVGSGVYSVGHDCESGSSDVLSLLADLREKGMVEEVWNHTDGEFRRICGST
ncbi:hypothetical protein VTO42DRAFT_780 [Malbranchea cinnamomea]